MTQCDLCGSHKHRRNRLWFQNRMHTFCYKMTTLDQLAPLGLRHGGVFHVHRVFKSITVLRCSLCTGELGRPATAAWLTCALQIRAIALELFERGR
jgi:hypothetical protein